MWLGIFLRVLTERDQLFIRSITPPKIKRSVGKPQSFSDCYIKWELIQAFMDITQPLPDIPEFEPFRAYDPTTIQWDAKNKRPEGFYQRISLRGYRKLRKRVYNDYFIRYNNSSQLNAGYPYGKTLDEAIRENLYKHLTEKIWTLFPSEELGFEPSLWKVYNPHYARAEYNELHKKQKLSLTIRNRLKK